MADLPEALITPTRTEIVRRYERDYKLWRPGAKIGDKTQVNVDARVVADITLPLYARADRLARLARLEDMTSEQLEDEADRTGIEKRLPATGATGFVTVKTSVGGAAVLAGDELSVEGTQLLYQFTQSGTFTDGAEIGIAGITTGPGTNLPPGSVLTISNPRPGMGTTCTVVEQDNGIGLKGGHDVESDPELIERIRDARANPPAAGNDAQIHKAVRETPNIPVQSPFTYPAFGGPGTTSVTFTLRPIATGGERIPDAIQRTLVYNRLRSLFPIDFTIAMAAIIDQPIAVSLRITWSKHTQGWADVAPWPLVSDPWVIKSSPAPTATGFRVTGGATAPSVGTTFAFYDTTSARFVRKKALTVTATGSDFDIVCDVSNNASDANYAPVAGEAICPWSDSLQLLVLPTLGHFDLLGPGEQFSGFFDEELRQRRSPPSPDEWPSELTGRLLTVLYALPSVSDVTVSSPTLPFAPAVGAPGDYVYLLRMNKLYAYP